MTIVSHPFFVYGHIQGMKASTELAQCIRYVLYYCIYSTTNQLTLFFGISLVDLFSETC